MGHVLVRRPRSPGRLGGDRHRPRRGPAAAHLAADGRIEAAAPGWTGRSAAALAQRAARWSGGVDGAGHPHRRARPGSAHLRPGVRVHRGAAGRAPWPSCRTCREQPGCGHTLIAMTSERRQPNVVVLGGAPGDHRRVHLFSPRADPAVGALAGDGRRHQQEPPQLRLSRRRGGVVETLRATTDFTEAANCADVVVMGVPSHGFRGVLEELGKELRPWVPVVSLVKGLEQGTNMRMSQIVDEVLPGHPAGILAGPNIARRSPRDTPRPRCWPCPTRTWRPTWQRCSAPGDSAPTPPTTSSASRWPVR